jgi:exodeoxyribonuclease X
MTTFDFAASWTSVRWAVVDVEGNGQQPPNLVELAITPVVDGSIGTPRTWLVKPPRPITSMARRFHKISDEQVADRPAVTEVAEQVAAELDGAVFVAHNAHVDLGVLIHEIPGYEPVHGVADTLKLARKLVGGLESYKLGALVDAYALADDLPVGLRPHRAEYDSLVCARLLVYLASMPSTGRTLGELLTTPPATGGEGDESAALF